MPRPLAHVLFDSSERLCVSRRSAEDLKEVLSQIGDDLDSLER